MLEGLIAAWIGDTANLFLYGFLMLAAVTLVRGVYRDRRRTREFRRLAEAAEFLLLGFRCPARISSESHVLQAGTVNPSSMRSSWDRNTDHLRRLRTRVRTGRIYRTVVGLRGDRSGFGNAGIGPDLVTEAVDGWSLVYGDRRLMEVEEVSRLVREALMNDDRRSG